MQAAFIFMLLVWIDLTMRQRDASQGREAGLLIAIVYHHSYTHA